jgi:Xaa-Pro aminopeptidase
MPPTPHTNEELARVRAELAALGADFALITSDENVTYISQWEVPVDFGPSSATRYVAPLAYFGVGDDVGGLIVSDSYAGGARQHNTLGDVLTYPSFSVDGPTNPREGFLDALRGVLSAADLGSATLAVEMKSLSAAALQLINALYPNVKLIDAAPALEAARAIKTEREIGLLRAVAEVNRAGHTELLAQTRESGKSEFAIWSAVIQAMERKAGRSLFVFGELVTGPRVSVVRYPGGPQHVTTQDGDMALMDMSVRLDGYYSDCTNTMVVGPVEPTATQKLYGVAAREAFHAAAEMLRPGRKAYEAYDAAKDTFTKHGLEIGHYAGHQIGVTVNENPRLVPWEQTEIRAGMVFSIETGAYEGPNGSSGSRMEKSVIVHDSGPEIICDFEWGF